MTIAVRRIVINTVSGSGARIAALGIAFLTTPVLVNQLGSEGFGLFSIAAALPAYAGLLDFGIGAGLVKHFTEYSEAGDTDGVRQVMTLSLCFYLVLGALLTPVAVLLAPSIAGLLGLSEEYRRAAEVSVVIMFLYFIASGLVGIVSARLVSLHRMDITAGVGLLAQAAYGAAVFLVLPLSPTVLTAIWLTVFQLLLTGVLLYVIVVRADRRLFCNPLAIPGTLVRKLFAFGGWMQLNSLTALVNLEADKLIIAGFLNMAAVTPYQIANRLASVNRLIPFQLLSALMPAATMMQLSHSRAEAAQFYSHMSRYLMLLTLVITGFTAVAADRFILTWIGQPYPPASLIVVALCLSFAVNNLTGGGTTMARAAGLPRYETYYAVLSMVLNIGLTVALAPSFGLAGILGGTIIANVVGSVYFLAIFHRRFAISWYATMGDWLWRLLGAMALACATVAVLQALEPASLGTDRLTGLVLLGVYGIAYLVVFAAGLSLLGFWSSGDIDIFRRLRLKIVPAKQG